MLDTRVEHESLNENEKSESHKLSSIFDFPKRRKKFNLGIKKPKWIGGLYRLNCELKNSV